MNLLVTGGAGFIGSNVIRKVIDNPEIDRLVNLDLLTYAGHKENTTDVATHPKYTFEKADIRDRNAVQRIIRIYDITHVIHLAAESHVDRSIAGPEDFITTNVLGTFTLLEACRAHWGSDVANKRFHHVSTDEVFGSLGATGYFSEETPYAPNSPYSASKASSDLLVRSYFHTYRFPVVTTNCSNNYGPYQFPEKLIPVCIQQMLAAKPIPVYGKGANVRDWLYVGDHVEALWNVLTRGTNGETYTIGGNEERSNIQLVEYLCDLMDELRPIKGFTYRSLITFVEDRPGHDQRYAIDASKIKRTLGWSPSYTFERGMRETVSWYLSNQDWVESVTRA